MLKTKQPPPVLSLDEQIAELHARIDALIEAKANELRRQYEGTFSLEYIKFDLKKNAFNCPCRQYLELKSEEERGS
jgi:hypothetical protein